MVKCSTTLCCKEHRGWLLDTTPTCTNCTCTLHCRHLFNFCKFLPFSSVSNVWTFWFRINKYAGAFALAAFFEMTATYAVPFVPARLQRSIHFFLILHWLENERDDTVRRSYYVDHSCGCTQKQNNTPWFSEVLSWKRRRARLTQPIVLWEKLYASFG